MSAKNMTIYDALRKTPDAAKRQISGGRLSGFTDISPQYRIERLTELFGPCGIGWYYEPTRKWTEQVANEVLCFVDISLYIKDGNDWSKPIHGTGGSMIGTNERNGLRASDEGYKMATTDAISVACKQLGIGADVYWQAGESKYSRQEAPSQPVEAPSKPVEAPKPADRPLTWQEQTEIICNVNRIKMDLFKDLFSALKQDGKFVNKTVDKLTPDEWQTLKPLIAAAVNATKPK